MSEHDKEFERAVREYDQLLDPRLAAAKLLQDVHNVSSRMRKIGKTDLIKLLQATLEAIQQDDSFEGRLEYSCMQDEDDPDYVGELAGDEFAVAAFIRVGNRHGQGGCIMIDGEVA